MEALNAVRDVDGAARFEPLLHTWQAGMERALSVRLGDAGRAVAMGFKLVADTSSLTACER